MCIFFSFLRAISVYGFSSDGPYIWISYHLICKDFRVKLAWVAIFFSKITYKAPYRDESRSSNHLVVQLPHRKAGNEVLNVALRTGNIPGRRSYIGIFQILRISKLCENSNVWFKGRKFFAYSIFLQNRM